MCRGNVIRAEKDAHCDYQDSPFFLFYILKNSFKEDLYPSVTTFSTVTFRKKIFFLILPFNGGKCFWPENSSFLLWFMLNR